MNRNCSYDFGVACTILNFTPLPIPVYLRLCVVVGGWGGGTSSLIVGQRTLPPVARPRRHSSARRFVCADCPVVDTYCSPSPHCLGKPQRGPSRPAVSRTRDPVVNDCCCVVIVVFAARGGIALSPRPRELLRGERVTGRNAGGRACCPLPLA